MQVTAERDPLVKVGGLGEAVAGLSGALTRIGWEVDTVLPDYDGRALVDESAERLPVPRWAGDIRARRGLLSGVGRVTLIDNDAIRRPHPYVDPRTGESWPDNDARFLAFAAGAAALANLDRPAILHAHDWHAAGALCLVDEATPTVLSIHSLAHRGVTGASWMDRLGPGARAMQVPDGCDPLAGGIRSARAIVTVSPTYRREICTTSSAALSQVLAAKESHLTGIVNGIDTGRWNPSTDPRIPFGFDRHDRTGKAACRDHLCRRLDRAGRQGPVVAVVSRMAHQKGIDIAVAMSPLIAAADGLLVIHGEGQHDVADLARRAAAGDHDHVVVVDGYDETTAHRILAGADLLLMPSRFEPCGLTQLQAMTYGTIPVVTDVGGLHDTVQDADRWPCSGTGFVASHTDCGAVADALSRALAAFAQPGRWAQLQTRAMSSDWGWDAPAARYDNIYRSITR